MTHFRDMAGQSITVGDYTSEIGTFEQTDGHVDIILLRSSDTEIFFRPSGTGPDVRIYVFGPASTYKEQLALVQHWIEGIFGL
jgi:phosphomannomutase